jgi:hypothetical protein
MKKLVFIIICVLWVQNIYVQNNQLHKSNNIFNLVGAKKRINNKIIEISGEKTGNIQINYVDQNNITINSTIRGERQANNTKVMINNEYYIQISMVRYLINGALKQGKNNVILYTPDYERLDIPL